MQRDVDKILDFVLEKEKIERSKITNFDVVKQSVVSKLESLKSIPQRKENPGE
jgi:hypothetical protein